MLEAQGPMVEQAIAPRRQSYQLELIGEVPETIYPAIWRFVMSYLEREIAEGRWVRVPRGDYDELRPVEMAGPEGK